MPCAGIVGNPFHGIAWLQVDIKGITHLSQQHQDQHQDQEQHQDQIYLPPNSSSSNLHNALKVRMHSKYKLYYANPHTGSYI